MSEKIIVEDLSNRVMDETLVKKYSEETFSLILQDALVHKLTASESIFAMRVMAEIAKDYLIELEFVKESEISDINNDAVEISSNVINNMKESGKLETIKKFMDMVKSVKPQEK